MNMKWTSFLLALSITAQAAVPPNIGGGISSATAPLNFNSTTHVLLMPVASSVADGYLSSAHWSLFNAKEPAFASGTTGQYFRGDKTFQTLDKSAVGLANVDNTSDANKPVSSATSTALSLKANLASPSFSGSPTAPTQTQGDNSTNLSTTAYVDTAVSSATIPDATTLVKGKVKLAGDLSGTADLPTVPGLASKEPSISAGTTSQYFRGDKTFQTLDKTAVGLPNVDNTSDANKPVSTATQTALNLKADLASPSFSGSPTAPTQTQGDASTKLSTTAYVDTAVAAATIPDATTLIKGKIKLAGDLSGTADLPTVPGLSSKEPTITAGTSSQYWRGDKTFQTLDTLAVSENTNLYFTDARAVSAVTSSQTAQALYVAGDNGNDSNACTLLAPCKTIQHTITVANAIAAYYKQVIVFVSPHTSTAGYAENITLAQQGVNLQCYNPVPSSRACLVKGTLTVQLDNTSGSGNFVASLNEVYVNGFIFGASTSGAVVNFTGAKYQKLVAVNCYFQNTGTGNSAIVSNNGFTSGTPSEFRSYDTTFENSNSSSPTVSQSAGRFWLYGMTSTVQNKNTSGPSFAQAPTATTTGNLSSGSACISSPGSLTNIVVGQAISDVTSLVNSVNVPSGTTVAGLPGTCSAGQIQMSANAAGTETTASLNFGGSSMIGNFTQYIGQYQLTDNVATATFNLSTIASGTASCISTPTLPNTGYALLAYFGCNSTNTNSITGSGVIANGPGNLRFGSSGDIVSTVTQASAGPGLPQGEVMIGPGSTTGTNVLLSIFGGHIKVSQTTAPTASPSANAGTSATCTLTNGRDSSGIINLTEGSGSWASGTQCTVTFNKAYGVAPNCVIAPHNAAAASHAVTQQFFSTTTTTTLLLATGVADSAATASQWSYKCEEP